MMWLCWQMPIFSWWLYVEIFYSCKNLEQWTFIWRNIAETLSKRCVSSNSRRWASLSLRCWSVPQGFGLESKTISHGSTVKNLTLAFFAQTFGGSSYTCMEARKHNLGQKVNVKFDTVDPYSGGTGVPLTFLEMGKIQKNIFLKIKTSIIKSEKNIYQTIHNTRFIFNFFGIFTIFLYFSWFFGKKVPKFWKNYTFI